MKGTTPSGVAFDVRGDAGGAPILLVRPLGGSMDLWGPFRTELSRELRVVSFDARGTGRSAGPARKSIAEMADDAVAVLDQLAIDRAHVFGLSLGGIVAVDLASRRPDRVHALVLASTPARGSSLLRIIGTRGASLAACFVKREPGLDECLAERILPPSFAVDHPREMRWIRRAIARRPSSRATLVRHMTAAVRARTGARLRTIAAPTLVLVGDHDALLGARAGVELARRIPNARREVMRDGSHALEWTQPIETARRVLAFVRRA